MGDWHFQIINANKSDILKIIFVRIITLVHKGQIGHLGRPGPVDNFVDNEDRGVTKTTKIVVRHARNTPQNVSAPCYTSIIRKLRKEK
jgi:hypothetical protein